jgi:hypothetical protein
MPLDIALVGPDGTLIDRVFRSQGEFVHDVSGAGGSGA